MKLLNHMGWCQGLLANMGVWDVSGKSAVHRTLLGYYLLVDGDGIGNPGDKSGHPFSVWFSALSVT